MCPLPCGSGPSSPVSSTPKTATPGVSTERSVPGPGRSLQDLVLESILIRPALLVSVCTGPVKVFNTIAGWYRTVEGGSSLFREAKEGFPEEVTLELRSKVCESVNLVISEQRRNVKYSVVKKTISERGAERPG